MKNLIIFSMLAVMVIINFSGCGKAEERPSEPNKKIAGQVIAIDGLVDITKAEHQNSDENTAFKKQLIAKLDSAEKRTFAESLMAQNKLVFMLMDEKILLLEFVAAQQNKHITATTQVADAASETLEISTEQVAQPVKLYTFDALIAMKTGENQTWSKLSVASQNRFAILAEIGIQTGVLENETTDYNEKKSTLKLTETSLDQAQFLILKSEIKAEAETKDAASDDAQK